MARPRAILFDWDNTLVDSWDTIHDALGHAFIALGREPWTLAEVKERTRLSLSDAFPALFGDRWSEARRHYHDRFLEIHLERIKPLPGAEQLLDLLGTIGVPLAVVSNKTGYVLRLEAEHFGWSGRFRSLIGAGDAAADKPDRAPILLALRSVGLSPGPDIWYVGDTEMDMACAANSGCAGVLLAGELAEPNGAAVPLFHFSGCEAFARYLKGL